MYGAIDTTRIGDEELLEDIEGVADGKLNGNQSYRAEYGHDHVHVKYFSYDRRRFAQANIGAYLVLEELDILQPDTAYDPVERRLITSWIDHTERADEVNPRHRPVDEDSYLDAVAARILVGDADVDHLDENLLIDPHGDVYPIDFDIAGYRLDRGVSSHFRLDEKLYDQLLEETEELGRDLGLDIDQNDVEERAYELADRLDPDRIDAKLDREIHLRDFERTGNFAYNVSLLQDRYRT